MAFFSRIFRRTPPQVRAAGTVDYVSAPDIFNFPYLNLNPTAEACLRKIVSTLASLKLELYTHRKGGGRSLVVTHPLFAALKNPDPNMTPIQFYSQLIDDIMRGDAYLHIIKAGGQILFERLDPRAVRPSNLSGRIVYQYGQQTYTDRDVLHIPYPFATKTVNGVVYGVAPEEKYRDLITLDNALTAYIKMYFGNSIGKRTVVEMGDSWTGKKLDEAYALIAPAVQKFVYGAANAGKPIIPPPGTKLTTIDQTQNLYTDIKSLKEMIERQIAQGFGVPYSLLSETNKYNSLEANQLQFLADTIEPLGTHIEQSFDRLLDPAETALYCKYDYKAMLQSDVKTTVEYLAKEVQAGLLTINEARDKLDLSAVDAGDYTFVPANLWPLTVDNVDAFFAQSKLAMHNGAGDEKQ